MSKIFDEFQNLVMSRPHYVSRGFYNVDCPACGDNRKRGGFAPTDTGGFRYKCFNGGCPYNEQPTGWEEGNGLTGRARQLFETLGGDIRSIPTSELMRKRRTNADGVAEPRLSLATKFNDAAMPAGTMLLEDAAERHTDAEECMAYLWERSPMFLEVDFPFMWSHKHPQHVLVPYLHYNDQIVGYMGRHITATHGAERFIQRAPRDYMFNQYTIPKLTGKYVFVVESPLDAILLQGVATRENRLTTKQINLLKICGKEPVLVPDLHTGEAKPYMDVAEENNWLVAAPEWDYKDPGEAIQQMGLLTTIEGLTASMTRRYKRLKIRLGNKNQQ